MACLVFHTEVGWAARRCIRHIAVEEAVHNRKAAEGAEVAGSRHIHPEAEVGRNFEVAVVVLHILRGIQIQDSLTFLLDDGIEKEKRTDAVCGCLVRPDAERRFRRVRLSLAARLGTV